MGQQVVLSEVESAGLEQVSVKHIGNGKLVELSCSFSELDIIQTAIATEMF